MPPVPRTLVHDRLAELVERLSGAARTDAHDAVGDALARNGDAGDQLLNVADAIIILRRDRVEIDGPS